MAEVTGSVQPKDGRWHAVMNVTNENGERVKKWKSLRLDVQKGTKREAERRLKELLAKMNAGESYLTDTMTHAERERQPPRTYPCGGLSAGMAGGAQA